jgi:pimeloyl-ACP methyl ester carboxylesterase
LVAGAGIVAGPKKEPAMRVLVWLLFLTALAGGQSAAHAQSQNLEGVGVVLMHGKGGAPGDFIAPTAQALQAAGAKVVMPQMPWARARMYDASYEQALAEIDRAVAQLKAQGASKIVVAGQSFGANAAIGYAARRGGVAAVISLAAGHTPERPFFASHTASGVAKAKQLVADGKGDSPDSFPDMNQGKTFNVRATAKVYLSYFDPSGPAVIPRNAAAMKSVPFLWVIGSDDSLAAAGADYAFNKAPKHPKSKYLVVNAGHANTPDVAKAEVVAWLKSL